MARKPQLTLVKPNSTALNPLRKLGRHGRAFWAEVQSEYAITDRAGCELLQQACEELDMIEGLTADIAREGRTVLTPTGHKAHAAIRDVRQGRAVFARLLRDLGISLQPTKPVGRPAKGIGISWEQLQKERGLDDDE
jgi:hypothetical protein